MSDLGDPQPRSMPALLAPFAAVSRDGGDLRRNPLAVLGGLAGSGGFLGVVVAMALLGPSTSRADDDDDDELEMQFLPGALVRKGEKLDPSDIPEKVIVKETRAPDATAPVTVTRDDQALPSPESTDRPDPKLKPTPRPAPKNPTAPVSDRDREPTTPYDDPATADDAPGDPFGSTDGWADMAKDGDPWATAVLKALNGTQVGSYAGLGQDVSYKFQLVICADGSIDDVRTKLSTGRPDFDGQIRNALERLKLPKAPPAIAAQLGSRCKKIPYEFTWRGASSSGTVQ